MEVLLRMSEASSRRLEADALHEARLLVGLEAPE
jgi:hypothetical protein